MIIILLGPPGSGKGTQSNYLLTSLSAVHISTGSILRNEINNRTDLGLEVEQIIKSGRLVSNDLINKIIKKKLETIDLNNTNIILDGYPRNIEQAKYLEEIAKTSIKVIYLSLSDETIKKRLLGRFSCPICQTTYNSFYDKPAIEGECNNCGKVVFLKRHDDNEETVLYRLNEYKKETEPLIKYYSDHDLIFEIESDKIKEEVRDHILEYIKKA